MPAGLDEPGLLDYRYGLVDIHQVDCVGLLAQDNLDALVLAVLCDFGDRKPQEVVTYIVRRCGNCWAQTSGGSVTTWTCWRSSPKTGICRHKLRRLNTC